MNKLRVATICSGIGSPESALNLLNIPYELIYFCEFDKYAVKSYCAIHGEDESKNIGDLTKVDISKLPTDLDLIIGGTPCQDFSNAGKSAGGEVDSGTRSSLMWNLVEIIRQTKPKAVIWENVKGAMSEKNRTNYDKFISELRQLGYKVTPTVDNAKNFCCPQNRERIFVMAGQHHITPPQGYDCGIRLKDVLESNVDEKYYLSEKTIKHLNTHLERNKAKGNGFGWCPKNKNVIANTIKTEAGYGPDTNFIIEPRCEVVADLNIPGRLESACRVHSINGIAPACNTCGGGGLEIKILEPIYYGVDTKVSSSFTRPPLPNISRCIKAQNDGAGVIIPNGKTSNEIDCTYTDELGRGVWVHNGIHYRIRKLTPLECWRLMGFTDEQFYKAQTALKPYCKPSPNSQLYKQAGNSMVVSHIAAVIGEYYGIDWKPLVYGKWYKTETELLNDLPLFRLAQEGL